MCFITTKFSPTEGKRVLDKMQHFEIKKNERKRLVDLAPEHARAFGEEKNVNKFEGETIEDYPKRLEDVMQEVVGVNFHAYAINACQKAPVVATTSQVRI